MIAEAIQRKRPPADDIQAKRSVVKTKLAQYEQPDTRKAIWQLANTLIPYAGLWVLMAHLIKQGASLVSILPLTVLAAGFLVRVFIFFHDCGHKCFFPISRANKVVGNICGILTFTPFNEWTDRHADHHAHAGNLDKRGIGDVWTLTTEEFRNLSRRGQIGYQLYRNPLVLFVLGPIWLFFIRQRWAHKDSSADARKSIKLTNVGLIGLCLLGHVTLGLRTFLEIQLPIMVFAAMFGVWLFYVQHQFERVYWAHKAEWDVYQAGMEGSSYYKLPKILQWFSGNIGLHHIHHLKSKIPNYNLQRAIDEVAEAREIVPLTFSRSLKSAFLKLWDEDSRQMVSFRELRRMDRASARK